MSVPKWAVARITPAEALLRSPSCVCCDRPAIYRATNSLGEQRDYCDRCVGEVRA